MPWCRHKSRVYFKKTAMIVTTPKALEETLEKKSGVLGFHPAELNYSNFHLHTNHLEIWLKGRLWFSRSGEEPPCCISNKLPAVSDAAIQGPCTEEQSRRGVGRCTSGLTVEALAAASPDVWVPASPVQHRVWESLSEGCLRNDSAWQGRLHDPGVLTLAVSLCAVAALAEAHYAAKWIIHSEIIMGLHCQRAAPTGMNLERESIKKIAKLRDNVEPEIFSKWAIKGCLEKVNF